MIGLSGQMEIARRALLAHELAMSVIGNNIANVNTPGYSRRRALLESSGDVPVGPGYAGTGVDVTAIRRARDQFLDDLFRDHSTDAGRWDALSGALGEVEGILGEPDESGLSGLMTQFWSRWQDLANEPESQAVRQQVRGAGEQLTAAFRRLHDDLLAKQVNLTEEIGSEVDRINQMTERLARLNQTILEGELGGDEASGLRDERDRLLDELSRTVGVRVQENDGGSVTVFLGSEVLVQESTCRRLEMESGLAPGGGASRVLWEGTESGPPIASGTLEGLLEARDERIESYLRDLDTLAGGLVAEVNAAHAAGYGLDGSTGNLFFDPNRTTAADIQLDAGVLADVGRIAASSGGEVGDGTNALAIADLGSQMVLAGGTATFSGFYEGLTGRIGLDAREAESFRESAEVLLLDLDSRRQEVSGVSLDEELAYMMTFQHAYEAMVRVTRSVDEMTASLLEGLGA